MTTFAFLILYESLSKFNLKHYIPLISNMKKEMFLPFFCMRSGLVILFLKLLTISSEYVVTYPLVHRQAMDLLILIA